VLAGDEVPRASLGGTTRLGHTSWVRSRSDPDADQPDVNDLYLYPGFGAGAEKPVEGGI
jgi:type VI secretion system protein ImpH